MAKRSTRAPTLRKDRTGMSPVTVGILAAVVVLIITYFGFTKAIPFEHGFRLNAVFQSANSIRPSSPVRIAGVNVGKVVDVRREPGTNAAIVEMEIDDNGLPIHKDAQLKIRPRIFLEGNFFVDLKPGTPAAPALSDGDTVAITQTATPVQLDEVLTALQQPTRADLQELLQSLGGALNDKPTAAEDLTQDPQVQGKTAGQALNQALDYSASAAKNSAIVNQAIQGADPNDLSRLIASLSIVSKAVNRNERVLKDFVTNFNTTLSAFASQSSSLTAAVGLLGPTLTNANTALVSLNNSFPATRRFALELIPGTQETQATIDAATPWIEQATPLVGPSELGGLADLLQPTTASLAAVAADGIQTFKQGDLLSKCQTKVFLPTGDIKIEDGSLSTGVENYKEFWYSMVGFAGEGQNFDGNGQYIRVSPQGGSTFVKTGATTHGALFGNAIVPPLGTRPAYTKKTPPIVSSKPCYKQPIPDLNAAKVGPREGGAPGVLPTSTPTGTVPASGATTRSATPQSATQARSTSSSTSAARKNDGSVADELLSRLNPYRTTETGR